MNRIFKFRVWDTKHKEWENPAILEVFNRDGIFRPLYDAEDYVIQQYIGLKDVDKKDIYEGDLVKADPGDPFEVSFKDGSFILNHKNGYTTLAGSLINSWNLKIIGNIFENDNVYNTDKK